MKAGDLVSMRSGSVDPPTGIIVDTSHEDDDGTWCIILWDDGDLVGCWGEELTQVMCKTSKLVI